MGHYDEFFEEEVERKITSATQLYSEAVKDFFRVNKDTVVPLLQNLNPFKQNVESAERFKKNLQEVLKLKPTFHKCDDTQLLEHLVTLTDTIIDKLKYRTGRSIGHKFLERLNHNRR